MDEKIVGVWFILTIHNVQDWMAGLREIVPEEKYSLTYRFRYYKDDNAWDSEDKKNWYEAEVTGTRAYCLASLRSVAEQLAKAARLRQEGNAEVGRVYEVINDSGYDEFQRKFMDMPFVFARQETKEQAMEREKSFDGVGTPAEDKAIAAALRKPQPWEKQ